MRRIAGLLLIVVTCLPCYNVGLATYAMPLGDAETAYAYGRGDSCYDTIGSPPWFGLYGKCVGWVTTEPITAVPDGRENDALEDGYQAAGTPVMIYGPHYGAGSDFRAGKELAAGDHPTDAVTTLGWGELRAVEPPTGFLLLLGLIAPALFLAGVGLLLWPRRS
jgi:hypothetical protein